MVRHQYAPGGHPGEWMVPTRGGRAIIHHGLEQDDSHAACGPMLFCCDRAQRLYLRSWARPAEARAEWRSVDPETICGWLEGGVPLAYFIFCDPESELHLRAIGLSARADLPAVVRREIPLEDYRAEAATLEVEPDGFLVQLLRSGR